jgi:mono/diheme cytochrome c family protein
VDAGASVEVDSGATEVDAASAVPIVVDGGNVADGATDAGARGGNRASGHSGTAAATGTAAGNVANGRSAFQRTCNRCHPNGEDDTGPRINNINWSEARMRTQIRQGSGAMRPIPVSRLSDADLTDLLAYLRTTHAVR